MRTVALAMIALFVFAMFCGCRGSSPPPEPAAAPSTLGAAKCAGKSTYKMQEPTGGGCMGGPRKGCGGGS